MKNKKNKSEKNTSLDEKSKNNEENKSTNEKEDVSILTTQEQGNIVAFVDESGDKASLKFCRN